MSDLRQRAEQAHQQTQAAQQAKQRRQQQAAADRRQEAHQAYQQLYDTIKGVLLHRFGIPPDTIEVLQRVGSNGTTVPLEQPPDALVIDVDDITLIAGNCRALAAAADDDGLTVHLTEHTVDTASGHPYWKAVSRNLNNLTDLGRALHVTGH